MCLQKYQLAATQKIGEAGSTENQSEDYCKCPGKKYEPIKYSNINITLELFVGGWRQGSKIPKLPVMGMASTETGCRE